MLCSYPHVASLDCVPVHNASVPTAPASNRHQGRECTSSTILNLDTSRIDWCYCIFMLDFSIEHCLGSVLGIHKLMSLLSRCCGKLLSTHPSSENAANFLYCLAPGISSAILALCMALCRQRHHNISRHARIVWPRTFLWPLFGPIDPRCLHNKEAHETLKSLLLHRTCSSALM